VKRCARLVQGVALAVAVALAACGGAAPAGAPSSVPPAARCTGPVPPNATLCPGADAGLVADAPRVVHAAPCAATPCGYVCNADAVLDAGGTCQRKAAGPPAAQFKDNGDGTVTVTDALGAVTWLRDANCTETVGGEARGEGPLPFAEAMAWSAGLADGACGLADGSAAGTWWLPGKEQLLRLQLELAAANPFVGLQAGTYWTAYTYWWDRADGIDLYTGALAEYPKTSPLFVWPVRQ
jgi:hypothetical protein